MLVFELRECGRGRLLIGWGIPSGLTRFGLFVPIELNKALPKVRKTGAPRRLSV
jgi:hypothetical protein